MRARTIINGLLALYLVMIVVGLTFMPWQSIVLILGFNAIYLLNVISDNWQEMKTDWVENKVISK